MATVPNKVALLAWVERLEAGTDVQGKGALCVRVGDVEKMCCLGVVTEMNREALGLEKVDMGSEERYGEVRTVFGYREGTMVRETSVLPGPVLEFLGLDAYNPEVTHPDTGHRVTVATLNDEGVTFPQIAAAIRKEYDL